MAGLLWAGPDCDLRCGATMPGTSKVVIWLPFVCGLVVDTFCLPHGKRKGNKKERATLR
jgi:hypothetical protein